ncbi:hypothetical protein [Streptomyces sp. NPDC018321]
MVNLMAGSAGGLEFRLAVVALDDVLDDVLEARAKTGRHTPDMPAAAR